MIGPRSCDPEVEFYDKKARRDGGHFVCEEGAGLCGEHRHSFRVDEFLHAEATMFAAKA